MACYEQLLSLPYFMSIDHGDSVFEKVACSVDDRLGRERNRANMGLVYSAISAAKLGASGVNELEPCQDTQLTLVN